jgi:hypothetical protein
MANAKLKELVEDGFKVVERRRDCTYVVRGADNRIVFMDGSVRRGQPAHRGKSKREVSTVRVVSKKIRNAAQGLLR